MPPSPSDKSGLPPTAVSALNKLSAGMFCNLLSTFINNVSTMGWQAAAGLLEPTTAGAVLGIAGIFGITEACKSVKDRKKAATVAEEIRKLGKQQGTALDLLQKIANQEIGVTLDWFTQQELIERIVNALKDAGVVTSLPTNNFAQAGVIHNADFVGRVEILKELHERLEQGDVAITHDLPGAEATAQALRGEGGIGKTQIAIRYAFEHADDYAGCWWIDASKEAIDASAASLATTLGQPPGAKDTPEQICTAIRSKLSTGKHLLILDNVEDAARVQGFLLRAPSRVLITTRLGTLPTGFVNEFPVSVFKRHESIALLRKHRTDLTGPEHEEGLGRVADHLGDHALAVTVTAAYLRKRPSTSPAELLERLQRAELGEKAHLLEKLDPAEHTAGYRRSVAESLSLHLPDFRETPAMDILAVAALCHPDNIPIDLFCDTLDLSRESVEDWLVRLADVSIIRYEGKTVSIHRLMQEVIRVEIGKEHQRKVLERLIGRLAKCFEAPDDYRNWGMQDAYAAHAESAIEHAERVGEIPETGFLANQLGLYFRNRARFDVALSALRAAERIDRAAFGDDHPNVATDVNNIGSVLRTKGDLDGALKCYREAERIDRAVFGDNHPNVAAVVNNIGNVLQDKGDLDGALKCSREAERINRAAFGDNHPNIASSVNSIGFVLMAKGDLDGAFKCFREAERIDRAAYGDNHPNVAIRVNNIGLVLMAKGNLDGALKCYREAERIDRAAYGDNHPKVAIRVNNIGGVLLEKGDHDGAGKMMCEAFRIVLTTLGPRALNTVSGAKNLIALGLDPLGLAREIAGEEVADQLRSALAEGGEG